MTSTASIWPAAVLPHSVQGNASRPRLVQAAHEFEAQMMKELLHPLSNLEGEDENDSDMGSSGALADFAAEALGQSLSARGGLGIATSILHSLSHNENASQSASKERNPLALSTLSAISPLK